MKIMLDEGAIMPTRAHDTDAGLDLYNKDRTVIIKKGGSQVFHTGVHVQIPMGCAGLLVSKSGLNVKHGILSTGLIDEGYTGEIVVKLYNMGDEDYMIQRGEKISQLVIIWREVFCANLELVDSFEKTERGDNGCGSSGS